MTMIEKVGVKMRGLLHHEQTPVASQDVFSVESVTVKDDGTPENATNEPFIFGKPIKDEWFKETYYM
jgi:hypothetical protein